MSVSGKDVEMTIERHQFSDELQKKNMLFDIHVKTPQKNITVIKSYKDFKVFIYQLKKSFSDLGNVKLPNKRFFTVKSDNEIFKERKDALVTLLSKILSIDGIVENDTFRSFFQLYVDVSLGSAEIMTNSPMPNEGDDFYDFIPQQFANKASITDFELLKVIGKGSFGRVLLVRYKNEDKYYAMKILEKALIVQRKEIRHIMAERAVLMKNVKHPFLVGLHFAFQTKDKLYFVLDYVNGGELFFHLQNEGTFAEPRVKFYCAEIGDALGYLHALNIIYRDLKPENILLDCQGHIVLTDFGLAKEIVNSEDTTMTFCGTPEYMAPEIILKQPYDKTVDWWTLGCVIFEMLNGLPPFYSKSVPEMYENIVKKEVVFRAQCSLSSKAFVQALLEKDNTKRLGYGTGDWNDIKAHSFLRNIDWDALREKKVEPPFNPGVTDELDLKNIDREFVCEEITESIMQDTSNPLQDKSGKDNPFVGFTYVQDSELD